MTENIKGLALTFLTFLTFLAFLAFLVFFTIPLAASAHKDHSGNQPVVERILIMRHAEKPDYPDDPNLTPAGFSRAQTLPKFILEQYGKPDYIFAAANSKKSMRPCETAAPLSQATGVPVDASFRDKDYKQLAETLLSDPRFQGKLIVVVWHHADIPELAHSLQAKEGTYPEKWDSSVFNRILQFDYTEKRHPKVAQIAEPF